MVRRFLQDAWQLQVPARRVCPGHVSPWEAFCAAYFALAPVTVWKASRGLGGKTWLLAALGLTEAVTLEADVTILGGSGLQSERVHEASRRAWEQPQAPRDLLRSDPIKRETRLRHRSGRTCTIRALTASTRSVRGPHPQRLRVDEVDEMTIALLDAALGQPMALAPIPAQTVLSSTHHYVDGTMTDVLRRAAERGWPVLEWCYRETLEPHGWLPPEEIARKRTEVTAQTWAWEFEGQEPSPEDRVWTPEVLARLFDPARGSFVGRPGEYIELAAPVSGRARYAHGVDWARKVDWTVIATLRVDQRPWSLVAFERFQRRDWPPTLERLEARYRRFRGPIAHDATGLGDVLGQHGFAKVPLEDVNLGSRIERAALLAEYVAAVDHGELRAPAIDALVHEHQFATQEALYGGGHLPDTICAMALARRAGLRAVVARGSPGGVEAPSYWRG